MGHFLSYLLDASVQLAINFLPPPTKGHNCHVEPTTKSASAIATPEQQFHLQSYLLNFDRLPTETTVKMVNC